MQRWTSKRNKSFVAKRSKPKKIWNFLSIFFGTFLALIAGYIFYLFQIQVISPLPEVVKKTPIVIPSDPIQIVSKKLTEKKVTFTSVAVASDSSYVVFLPDQSQAILSKNKNIDEQVSSLQLLLLRLTIEGKALKRLDLRFEKPIVEFK